MHKTRTHLDRTMDFRNVRGQRLGGDRDKRQSVTGWCILINDSLINWGSFSQNNVTLSSSEAEYVGISEICKEILFTRQILYFFHIRVTYPIIIQVDNVGAIYISKGSSGRLTKHIDIRYHFIHEYIEQGIVKRIFVRSANNKADTFTKNTNEPTHQRHCETYMSNINETYTNKK